ncbi:MAG TPA: DUF2520 domain-containing protein [Ferruginibacter sp.]|nr:DUF2520 domain-containing protein [Ferruginibacter sp.]
MKVGLIGSGNVATVLGRLLLQHNHTVTQVISRELSHAKILATEMNAHSDDFSGTPDASADVFIIAVADSALQGCLEQFDVGNKLVVHTAGSVAMDVLKNVSANYGVLYPLQSLRKEMPLLPSVPFLVDGNTPDVTEFIRVFALSLSPHVSVTNDDERLKLHTAAVIVSNFTNHLYAIAEDFCIKEKIDFKLLRPLIVETAQRIENISPSEVQTGPAIRKDIHTLDKHLRLLSAHPKLRTTYLRLTDSIMNP